MSRAVLQNPDCSHVALLRSLADRLEAIGGPMAEIALNRLAASTEDHIKTVEIVIELIESIENAAPIH